MDRKMWHRALVAALVIVTVTGGATAAAADEAHRLTGADPAHESVGGGVAPASTVVALPDLAIAHRLPSGGMNLWRMPLSELEDGFGQPQLVKTLDFGGFSYDNSRTIAGDFGDITASDDGTADHLIWHRQPNGGVLLWAVGGGADTTPRLWHDLRTGGWSYAASTPMVGDVNGDGWDDLVVTHSTGNRGDTNIWVFPSDGTRLTAPQHWATKRSGDSVLPPRFLLGDLSRDGEGRDDVIEVQGDVYRFVGGTLQSVLQYGAWTSGSLQSYYTDAVFYGPKSAGWSFGSSRQLTGDVTGDGLIDVVTVHAQPKGGILVWMHRGCSYDTGTQYCMEAPVVWQDLRTGGWSFAGSRQHLADTDGDGRQDLVSLHSQGGHPGILVWRHRSTGTGLETPEVMADLKTGGWSYASSREAVADLYGTFVG
ncbi:FG-GAP repeat protein [Blastococcus colisei]|uniref:FG-GAP repeat protein n=1 Tax=Blastococcus colisei TaxID=1564162 RepID=A0A543PDZ8_9ACTN|nr:VCBS repeat-containing protein [Blastococcus colisei]TQN42305.1 FG-GAP repeat protein [Blastococcus colisei]